MGRKPLNGIPVRPPRSHPIPSHQPPVRHRSKLPSHKRPLALGGIHVVENNANGRLFPSETPLFALSVLSKAPSGREEENINAKNSPSSRHSRLGTGAAPWGKRLCCTCGPPTSWVSFSGPLKPQWPPSIDQQTSSLWSVLNDAICSPAVWGQHTARGDGL